MSEEEVINLVSAALSAKFPKAEIVTYEEESSPYITVIDEKVTFDVVINMGEEYLGEQD